jgi:hypothetical protein
MRRGIPVRSPRLSRLTVSRRLSRVEWLLDFLEDVLHLLQAVPEPVDLHAEVGEPEVDIVEIYSGSSDRL